LSGELFRARNNFLDFSFFRVFLRQILLATSYSLHARSAGVRSA